MNNSSSIVAYRLADNEKARHRLGLVPISFGFDVSGSTNRKGRELVWEEGGQRRRGKRKRAQGPYAHSRIEDNSANRMNW